MVEIISGGDYEVLNGFGHDGSLIFKAATTCYKNEGHTKKTKEEFITMLKKNGHTAMLEFMWIVLRFDRAKYEMDFTDIYDFNYYIDTSLMLSGRKYVESDIVQESEGTVIVYGNARAFLQLFETIFIMKNASMITALNPIMIDCAVALQKINQVLFDFNMSTDLDTRCEALLPGDPVIVNRPWVNWKMIKLTDVSRGLTHELVRHRVMSFAQTSTRYVNHSGMKIVMPVLLGTDLPEDIRQRMIDCFSAVEATYSSAVKGGVSKGIARQLLPIGVVADICVAGTVHNWEELFALRTAEDAHWEIREMMLRISREVFNIIPADDIDDDIFD